MRSDYGAPNANMNAQFLFILRSADMTLTTDQAFTKQGNFTNYIVTGVVTKRVSGAYGTACLGGIYTAASKGGDALVAATQTYVNLSGANTSQVATMAAVALTKVQTATPFLALSTGNIGALTADIFVYGVILD